MDKREQIKILSEKIEKELKPTYLKIIDNSDKHKGHAGWRSGILTHVKIDIAAPTLEKLSRVEAQRAVNNALRDDMTDYLHAVQISIKSCKVP